MACKIDQNISFSCSDYEVSNPLDYFYIVNYEDFYNKQAFSTNATTGEVEVITLATGTQAYKYSVSRGSDHIVFSSVYNGRAGIDDYTHQLASRLSNISQIAKNEINKLKLTKVLVIIPLTNGKGVLLGKDVGLRSTDVTDTNVVDTQGTLMLTLATHASESERYLPMTISSDFDFTTLDAPAI